MRVLLITHTATINMQFPFAPLLQRPASFGQVGQPITLHRDKTRQAPPIYATSSFDSQPEVATMRPENCLQGF